MHFQIIGFYNLMMMKMNYANQARIGQAGYQEYLGGPLIQIEPPAFFCLGSSV